ncbi:MAG: hypothetical protein ACYC7E_05100 [Armatimonadota bacterium]
MQWLRRLLRSWDSLAHYRERESQAAVWTSRYPEHAEDALRFLEIINGAFILNRGMKEKISPDDEIMPLHEACIGIWKIDSMELEHLIFMTEDAFHCKFPQEIDIEGMTFGGFFEEAQRLAK